jgi:hypothetical protein
MNYSDYKTSLLSWGDTRYTFEGVKVSLCVDAAEYLQSSFLTSAPDHFEIYRDGANNFHAIYDFYMDGAHHINEETFEILTEKFPGSITVLSEVDDVILRVVIHQRKGHYVHAVEVNSAHELESAFESLLDEFSTCFSPVQISHFINTLQRYYLGEDENEEEAVYNFNFEIEDYL